MEIRDLTAEELQHLRKRGEELGLSEGTLNRLDAIIKKRNPNKRDLQALERMIADEQEYLSE